MGFVPIILTMCGAILLFFMAVNQSLISKKNMILRCQKELIAGLGHFASDISINPALDTNAIQQMEMSFRDAKSKLSGNSQAAFESTVALSYRDMRVTINQYNQLVQKKPYSYVASLMGHRKI